MTTSGNNVEDVDCPRRDLVVVLLDDRGDPERDDAGDAATARERAEAEAHVAGCAACRESLDELRALSRALRALPREAPSEDARGRAYAAVLSAMAASGPSAGVAEVRPREAARGPAPDAERDAAAPPARAGRLVRFPTLGAAAAAAACLLITVALVRGPGDAERSAKAPAADATPAAATAEARPAPAAPAPGHEALVAQLEAAREQAAREPGVTLGDMDGAEGDGSPDQAARRVGELAPPAPQEAARRRHAPPVAPAEPSAPGESPSAGPAARSAPGEPPSGGPAAPSAGEPPSPVPPGAPAPPASPPAARPAPARPTAGSPRPTAPAPPPAPPEESNATRPEPAPTPPAEGEPPGDSARARGARPDDAAGSSGGGRTGGAPATPLAGPADAPVADAPVEGVSATELVAAWSVHGRLYGVRAPRGEAPAELLRLTVRDAELLALATKAAPMRRLERDEGESGGGAPPATPGQSARPDRRDEAAPLGEPDGAPAAAAAADVDRAGALPLDARRLRASPELVEARRAPPAADGRTVEDLLAILRAEAGATPDQAWFTRLQALLLALEPQAERAARSRFAERADLDAQDVESLRRRARLQLDRMDAEVTPARPSR